MEVLAFYDQKSDLPLCLQEGYIPKTLPWKVIISPYRQDLSSPVTLYFKEKHTHVYINSKKISLTLEELFYLPKREPSSTHFIVLCEILFGVVGISTPSRREGHKQCGLSNRFLTEEEIYLASTDPVIPLLDRLKTLQRLTCLSEVEYLATVIGGFSVLNTLLFISPKKIIFFDCNYFMLPYARLILELIKCSCNHKEFIRRIYGRSLDLFFKKERVDDINESNQHKYLRGLRESEIDNETSKLLTSESRALFKRYFIEKTISFTYCRHLLPCWSSFKSVPVKLWEKQEQNTNSFFYGCGWLSNEKSYQLVKTRLFSAQIKFSLWDATCLPLSDLVDLKQKGCLFLSNIESFYPVECKMNISNILQKSVECGGDLVWISSEAFGGMERDPHQVALKEVASHIKGECVEVTRRIPGGFSELDRVNVHFQDYLSGHFPMETCVLHCLLSDGVDLDIFEKILQRSIEQSKKVIILEHQKESEDWKKERYKRLVSRKELEMSLKEIMSPPFRKVVFTNIAGKKDEKRNLLCVVT